MLIISNLLADVVNKETSVFASYQYPTNLVEIKDDNGKLIKVEYELKDHTQESFMMTAVSDNGAFAGLSPLGVKAAQVLNGLIWVHQDNIKKGIAKKQEQIDERRALKS